MNADSGMTNIRRARQFCGPLRMGVSYLLQLLVGQTDGMPAPYPTLVALARARFTMTEVSYAAERDLRA
jgi:hypothetical protein